MREFNLPDGTTTKNPKELEEKWKKFSKHIIDATGMQLSGFDPGIALVEYSGTATSSIALPNWFVTKLNDYIDKLIDKNQKSMELEAMELEEMEKRFPSFKALLKIQKEHTKEQWDKIWESFIEFQEKEKQEKEKEDIPVNYSTYSRWRY